jgi:hypothetical protein
MSKVPRRRQVVSFVVLAVVLLVLLVLTVIRAADGSTGFAVLGAILCFDCLRQAIGAAKGKPARRTPSYPITRLSLSGEGPVGRVAMSAYEHGFDRQRPSESRSTSETS